MHHAGYQWESDLNAAQGKAALSWNNCSFQVGGSCSTLPGSVTATGLSRWERQRMARNRAGEETQEGAQDSV